MKRKDFIKQFAMGGSILLTAPVIFSSCSDDDDDFIPEEPNNSDDIIIDLNATSSEKLNTVGGFIYSGSLIVFRTGTSTYSAVAKSCTHQGCPVTYDHANSNLPCTCHGSVFTIAGVVTTGPATVNLKKYNVVKDGDQLKISSS